MRQEGCVRKGTEQALPNRSELGETVFEKKKLRTSGKKRAGMQSPPIRNKRERILHENRIGEQEIGILNEMHQPYTILIRVDYTRTAGK